MLCPGRTASLTEGRTDQDLNLRSRGTIRAVVIFVDFDDAPGDDGSLDETGSHVHGSGAARQLLFEQSYGALTLDVTVRSDLGLLRMPEDASHYDLQIGTSQLEYMDHAAGLVPPDRLRFDEYDLVLVVPPPAAPFPLSPAFLNRRGTAAVSLSGRIRHGITFGQDSHTRDHRVLVHELGHVMGLPDLYPIGPVTAAACCHPPAREPNLVGPWDLMSDVDHGEHLLGWHRHKLGWLPPSRSVYLDRDTTRRRFSLHPLPEPDGLSMIVVPTGDMLHPRKVLAVEVAGLLPPVAEGVLVCSVDSGIDSGRSPVSVIPHGAGLDEAPYGVGATADIEDEDGARLTVEVLGRPGDVWDVEITFRPAPQD